MEGSHSTISSSSSSSKSKSKGHVLFLPFPGQGRINPILQFAKRLNSKGFKTTLATTIYHLKTIHLKDCNVEIESISDGFDETGPRGAGSGENFLSTFKEVGSRTLEDLIKKYTFTTDPITGLVCDAILPWGLDVGKQLGLVTAAFFTQPCGVSSIFYHVKQGHLSVPVQEATVSLPGLPELARQDLPSFLLTPEQPFSTALDLLVNQFSNTEKADWLLFNTFDDLESEVLNWMGKSWRARGIGPTTPSMYIDKRVENDKEYSLNLFKPSDTAYIEWLNSKETASVLYISFGSVAELGEEQMSELTSGIKQSKKDFLWVVRETEQSKLPAAFIEDMLDKGLFVTWCSQVEVLAHKAIGCFLTHCGWNSTMEALSLGVPMVAMPHTWDQLTNAKFIEDVWGVGIRVKKNDKEIVTKDEVELCIREVMEGEKGNAIKLNANRWREAAKIAVDESGSSDLNIEEFAVAVTY